MKIDDLLGELIIGDVLDDRDDPVGWIEREFYIPELSGPMKLAPYHKAVLREAYRRDENGHFVYSVIVWSDVKKSIKSSIAAAVALHRAFHTPYGMIKIIANDLKQADSRVAYYARRAVELNPRLAARVKVVNYRMSFDNKAFIEAIPVDPKGEAGGNDDFICFSELWAANQTAAIRMWTESTLSPTKFGQSQRWVETYAGFRGESPLLENLWEAGVNQGDKLDLSYTDEAGNWVDLRDLEVYANHGMLVMWNGIPRCEWQTNESGRKYYEEEARVLRPEEFNRVHRNQWATASSPFIPIEWWDKCQTEQLQPLDEFQTVIVGMDAATTNDTFAIVTVSRTKERVELREVRVFVPPKNGKLDFAQPEAYLRDLCSRFRVSAVVYDPYQLHELCTRLMKEGIAYFETFQQGAPRLKADKMLYDVIAGGRIAHDGSYPVMREHLLNASATSGENLRTDQMRIVKRVSSGNPIDAVVAMSMAVERAIFYNIGDF